MSVRDQANTRSSVMGRFLAGTFGRDPLAREKAREYQRSRLVEERLPAVVAVALEDPEIVRWMRRGKLDQSTAAAEVFAAQEVVLATAEDALEKWLDALFARRRAPWEAKVRAWTRRPAFRAVIGSLLVLPMLFEESAADKWDYGVGTLIGIGGWVLLYVIVNRTARPVYFLLAGRSQRSTKLAVASLERGWEDALLHNGVLPFLRRSLNARTHAHPMSLEVADAPGLATSATEPSLLVETASIRRFQETANRMADGAIGIAGPRGVGKTSLIQYFIRDLVAPLTVCVSAPVQYDAREFVLHLYATLCRAVVDLTYPDALFERLTLLRRRTTVEVTALAAVGIGSLSASVGSSMFRRFSDFKISGLPPFVAELVVATCLAIILLRLSYYRRSRARIMAELPQPDGFTISLTGFDRLRVASDARHRLDRIRFLQTRTSGWSGKVTLATKAEMGWNRSVQSAARPMTYPEIVAEVRDYLAEMVTRLRPADAKASVPMVVVAIDELDKIESAEQGQRFANEVKGLFGVSGTLFLVSVSDDALAAFEQRGMSMRDAFDSAFDEIVRIEHLNLADTRQMLHSRVVGVSEPFVCLVHCLSGGLAREVVRVARAMIANGDEVNPPGLHDVCEALVTWDMERWTRAFEAAAGKLTAPADITGYLRAVRSFHADSFRLLSQVSEFCTEHIEPTAGMAALQRLTAAYAYYCATVLEVFTPLVEELARNKGDCSFDELARARQSLSTHPQLASVLIDEFRAGLGLKTVELSNH
ncbi:MAG: hypothetical protein LLG14_15935 [Nocardiaceae bacterium]|nr:hypothetical protein [Nocardiaceae bacterium]